MAGLSIEPHEVNPWIEEPPLQDEYHNRAWNLMSPELEFCEYVADVIEGLVSSTAHVYVIETGVGQGFVTRRILEVLRDEDEYVGYDTGKRYLDLIPQELQPKFILGSPALARMAVADVVVLDSEIARREVELKAWIDYGKPGSHLIIHDVPQRMNTPTDLHKMITRSKIEGYWLGNHRGGWHGTK